jgi:hypothetical protein
MSKQLAEQATTPASHRWRDLIRRKDDGAGEIHWPAQANLRTIRWFSRLQGFLLPAGDRLYHCPAAGLLALRFWQPD